MSWAWPLLGVVVAAATGAFVGFWLVAEWTNVDDREMVGDPFPIAAIVAGTALGAVIVSGLGLLLVTWG